MSDVPNNAVTSGEGVAGSVANKPLQKTRGTFSADEIRAAMKLYAVTDRAWLNGRSLGACVREAIEGGTTFVQLREKDAPSEEIYALAKELQSVCAAYHVPFVINDDVALACEIKADGVHVGQDDMACKQARAMLGEDAIVGVSVQNLAQALKAQQDGADYVGVGAMFGTPTKTDAALVSFAELKRICTSIDIPAVAIGGLNKNTIDQLRGSGVDGVAVVSAVFAAPNCKTASQELNACIA